MGLESIATPTTMIETMSLGFNQHIRFGLCCTGRTGGITEHDLYRDSLVPIALKCVQVLQSLHVHVTPQHAIGGAGCFRHQGGIRFATQTIAGKACNQRRFGLEDLSRDCLHDLRNHQRAIAEDVYDAHAAPAV